MGGARCPAASVELGCHPDAQHSGNGGPEVDAQHLCAALHEVAQKQGPGAGWCGGVPGGQGTAPADIDDVEHGVSGAEPVPSPRPLRSWGGAAEVQVGPEAAGVHRGAQLGLQLTHPGEVDGMNRGIIHGRLVQLQELEPPAHMLGERLGGGRIPVARVGQPRPGDNRLSGFPPGGE